MTATRISTIRKIGLTLGLALSISTVATLSTFAFSSKARQMCTGDAFRLCSSEIPNIARITACMLRNKANVSPGCRAVMDQEEAAASKARVAATPVEQPAATKTKPVQAARVEQRPTTATTVEQSAATEAKPVQAAPFAQNPTTATPVEHAATKTKPVRAMPVEQKPATATPVEQSATTETKPVQTTSVKQKPTTATPVEQSAATETKSVQAAPVEPKPTTATPVEQPAATGTKPVQAMPVEQKPATAAPVEVKPVEAKSDPGGKPVKLAQRKRRHRRLPIEQQIDREFRNTDRAIGFALQISLAILRYW